MLELVVEDRELRANSDGAKPDLRWASDTKMDTNQLLSLFYCTFDNIHGPKIVYQEPDG